MGRTRWPAPLAGLLLNLVMPAAWSAEPSAPWFQVTAAPTIDGDPLIQVAHDG